MKLVLNSASSIVITVAVAIVSLSICVTETMSLDIGDFVDGILTVNGTTTNISSAIESMLQDNTYVNLLQDTDTILDGLFNETNATEAWNFMKDYLNDNNIDLAPVEYFEDILRDPGNYSKYLEGNFIINGTIDWNATYIIEELFNITALTQIWESIKTNVTNMNMNTLMPSSMVYCGGMAPAPAPTPTTTDMPTMDMPTLTMDIMKTNAPAMTPPSSATKTTMAPAITSSILGNIMPNSTIKVGTNSTSAATASTTVQAITRSFLVILVTATSSMFFAL